MNQFWVADGTFGSYGPGSKEEEVLVFQKCRPWFPLILLLTLLLIRPSRADDELEQGRPESLFRLVEEASKICQPILDRLNASYFPESGISDYGALLLHTGLEIGWRKERYFTRQFQLLEFDAIDVGQAQNTYSILRYSGSLSGRPAQFIFYAPQTLIDANKDQDGIISPRLLDTLAATSMPGIPKASPVTTRPYLADTIEMPSSYGKGMDVFTNSAISLDGQVAILLAPWIFTADNGSLKRPLTIYVVGIPQNPEEPLCRFVAK
jgi:hypothetical protein